MRSRMRRELLLRRSATSTPPSVRGKATKTVSGDNNEVDVAQADFDVAPQNGDLLVAFLSMTAVDSSDGSTIAPVGWDLQKTGSVTGTSIFLNTRIYTRVAGASEGTYAFTYSNGTDAFRANAICVLAISGADTTNPIDGAIATMLSATAGATAQNAPAAAPVSAASLLLCQWVAGYLTAGAATWTPASGMTEDVDFTGAGSSGTKICSASVDHKAITVAGSTGAQSATVSRASPGVTLACSITIKGR